MLLLLSLVQLISFCAVATAKSLWSTKPVQYSDLIRQAFPIGNGQLAVLPYGEPGKEVLNLNKDSLWSGGPFENASYAAANPSSSIAGAIPDITDWIFKNGTGNTSALQTDDPNYGNYYVLGNLSISMPVLANVTSNYKRSLDLNTGVHVTSFVSNGSSYSIQVFCSYPDNVCVYEATGDKSLPNLQIRFDNKLANASLVNASCSTETRSARIRGITQENIGMTYEAHAQVIGSNNVTCKDGIFTVIPSGKSIALVIAAGTNYDQSKGNKASNYSFRGADPAAVVASTASAAASKSVKQLLDTHIKDFQPLMERFTLSLPDTQNSSQIETSDLLSAYGDVASSSIAQTNPFIESLQFDLGRYLFISSSRPGSLPPNLQGKWAYGITNAWSADYHTDINLQMNHWGVDETGLGDLQTPLWTYMTETWVPRGTESAHLIYNASGWVVQSYINIFGHTGMNSGLDEWTDYPAAPAWLMLHVADYFDFTQDTTWLAETGYPLLKGVSEFWLSQLQLDRHANDGSLVAVPCDSPEHGPTTYGCAHYQQLIHSLFVNTLNAAKLINEPHKTFISGLTSALSKLDKGLHINSVPEIMEWKLPFDTVNDTHRHLSHLVGWYPGSSVSGYLGGYTNRAISDAVSNALWSRGPGIADDNAGWEKVWRAACWARLNDTERAYYELRLALQQNYAPNRLSMYAGREEPFQIDANFGYVGAVISMLVVDLPVESGQQDGRTVVLGPAIPGAWAGGSVEGLRVRGGGIVDFSWNDEGVVDKVSVRKAVKGVRFANKNGQMLA